MIATAWRLVVRRAAADRGPVLAGFVVVLLATALVAAASVYSEAAATAGLRQSLAAIPAAEGAIAVTAATTARERVTADDAVAAAAADLGPTAAEVVRWAQSSTYGLPGAEDGDEPSLTVLRVLDGIEGRTRLVTGTWPDASADGPVEAALSEAAAAQLGLAAGDEVTLRGRARGVADLPVRVSGVYAALDPADRAWFGDPLLVGGVERTGAFTTFGPLVVPAATLERVADGRPFEAGWYLFPRVADLVIDQTAPLRGAVEALDARIEGDLAGREVTVATPLPELLARAERSLLVTRAGVLVPTLQLALLAAYALLFVAGLLLGQRRAQSALLQARGAGPGLLVATALLEGVLLAVPAVLAGPWLAAGAVGLLDRAGPFAAAGLRLVPEVDLQTQLVALAAGLGAVLALTLPAVAGSGGRERPAVRPRARRRGAVQRGGVDVLLLAGGVLAVTQLQRYATPLLADPGGRLGVDPFLVAAPALVLVAGAVLALRLVPLAAGAAALPAEAGRGLPLSLGTRELSRRPLRHTPAALLVTMALAIGVFALAASATWLGSQQDQADHTTGADLRVVPVTGASAVAPLVARAALAGIPGVEAAVPVVRLSGHAGPATGGIEVLALDTERAAAVVALRPDLGDRPLAALLAPLARERPPSSAVALPAGTVRLGVTARLTLPPDLRPVELAMVVRDPDGIVQEVALGEVPADGDPRELTADLPSGGPLTLEQVRMTLPLPVRPESGTLELAGIRVIGTDDRSLPVPVAAGTSWQIPALDPGPAQVPPEVLSVTTGEAPLLRLQFTTGAGAEVGGGWAVFTIAPGPVPGDGVLPVLATDAFLAGARVGDEVPVRIAGDHRRLRVTGSVRGFPGMDPRVPAVVVDLATLAAWEAASGGLVLEPLEWWISAPDAAHAEVAAAVRAPPLSAREVVDRLEQGRTRRTDPLALGLVGVLLLGFAAAAVVAVIAVAVSTALSVRERAGEFAVLRALGLSTGQLSSWLAVESALSLGLGLVGGTVLGVLLARLVLPALALTQEGAQVMPPLRVLVPADEVALLVTLVTAALLTVVGVQVSLLRRTLPAPVLRAGEER